MFIEWLPIQSIKGNPIAQDDRKAWREYAAAALIGFLTKPDVYSKYFGQDQVVCLVSTYADAMLAAEKERFGNDPR